MPPTKSTDERRSSRIRIRQASNAKRARSSAPARAVVPESTSLNAPQNDTNNGEVLEKVSSLAASVMSLQEQLINVTNLVQTNIVNSNATSNSSSTVPEHVQNTTSNTIESAESPCTSSFVNGNDNFSVLNNEHMQNSLPLGSLINDTIKNKIWANEYVEFGSLLPKIQKPKLNPLILQNDPTLGKSQLAVQESPKEIKTMDEWISAFSIFMAIYCEKYKDAAPALLKYMSIVRDMAKKKGDWIEYDKTFRQAKCQIKVSWANMHHELCMLWLMSFMKENPITGTVAQGQNNNLNSYYNNQTNSVYGSGYIPLVPNGYCIRYHQGTFCQLPCRYNHKCYKCNRLHPASRCWQQGDSLNVNTNVSPRFDNFRPSSAHRIHGFKTNKQGVDFKDHHLEIPVFSFETNIKLPTPVKVNMLYKYLPGYDEDEICYLVEGFSKGFSVNCEKEIGESDCINLKSALERPEIVKQKIVKELLANRFAGPFLSKPFENLHLSPLGLCPKKEPNSYRMIHHLSYPAGDSINDFISKEFSSVNYTKLSDAIAGIRKFNQPCYLSKTDISQAYRNLPLKPEEYHLFGFKWNELFYYDKCLPMGCSSSCQIFERFSSSLEWIGEKHMPTGEIYHILDDFFIISPSIVEGKQHLATFLSICNDIGVPMAPEKTLGPVTCLTFWGIELDTVLQEARLPQEKLVKSLMMINEFLSHIKVTLKDIQTLCELLNFACSVVLPGRAFLRRLFDLTRGLKKAHHRVKLKRGCIDDLKVWKTFLENFNGKCFFIDEVWVTNEQVQLYTDASGSIGYGSVFENNWLYGIWNEEWLQYNITVKELYPIVVSLQTWGFKLSNKSICFNCDNEALVYVLNKQSSSEPNVMFLIRELVLLALRFNILFKAQHIPGKTNVLSDSLSRLQEFLVLKCAGCFPKQNNSE